MIKLEIEEAIKSHKKWGYDCGDEADSGGIWDYCASLASLLCNAKNFDYETFQSITYRYIADLPQDKSLIKNNRIKR